jgi:hypothetical protein
MRSRNPPMSPADLIAHQAAEHTDQIQKEWRLIFGPNESCPEEAIRTALTSLLAGQPTKGATLDEAAIHEAGHVVLFERMVLISVEN